MAIACLVYDGFYADIQAVFDLLRLRSPGKDSQAGFNVHLMALAIPLTQPAPGRIAWRRNDEEG